MMSDRLDPAEAHGSLLLQLERLGSAGGFRPDQTRRLAQNAHFRTYAPGEVVVPARTRADCLGLVVQGWLAVYPDKAGDNGSVSFLQSGHTFGRSMLMEGRPSGATYQAVTSCRIWFICQSDLRKLVTSRDGTGAASAILPRWASRAALILAVALVLVVVLSLPPTRRAMALVPMGLGQWCSGQGYHQCAERAWSEAAALAPGDVNPVVALGILYVDQGNLAAASRAFESARALLPDSPEIHNNLGLLYATRRDHGQAVVAYRRALELDPGSPAIHHNLGTSLQLLGLNDEALAHYESAAAAGEPQANTLVNMAIVYYENEQLVQAFDAGRQAVSLDDKLAPAYTVLGATALQLGHPAEALPYLRKAASLDQTDAQALFYLGYAYNAVGQITEAREALELAMSVADDEPLRVKIRRHLDELD